LVDKLSKTEKELRALEVEQQLNRGKNESFDQLTEKVITLEGNNYNLHNDIKMLEQQLKHYLHEN